MSERTDELLSILQTCFTPREEGWSWLALYRDDLAGGVVNQVEGAYEDVAQTASSLAFIINESKPDHAYLAVCRRDGRPVESDREMWRALRPLVPEQVLEDMVVFNGSRVWSMREEDADAAAAQSRTAG